MLTNSARGYRLRDRIFALGDRLARDVTQYAIAATVPAGSAAQVRWRAFALFAAAPAARGWLYR
jgi:hypothetical protein